MTVSKRANKLSFRPSVGGLATGLSSLSETEQCQWIGWPGIAKDKISRKQKKKIIAELADNNCHPVFISTSDISNFYHGFCNKTIWPLFHYFSLYTVYEERYWQSYQKVNHAFCDAIIELAGPGDRIWVHDYQLMLLCELIRRRLYDVQIGFFLHIPFPSYEIFRLLPWRNEILTGLLGADLIGFHTYDYVRHFLSSACRIAGIEHTMDRLTVHNRIVKVDAFPMGIDYERYAGAVLNANVKKNLTMTRKKVGKRKIILSVDRLDYTKGIIQRLEAFDLFLSQNPRYKENVTMIVLAVPSRTGVEDYMDLRQQLEGLVGRINGEHGRIGWIPVWYLYRAVPFERLAALYNIADVALVTPLRDGMNLIAKEFVATKTDGKGVLILSEMAGAASELGEAIIINANDKAAIIRAITEAIEMPEAEQIERNRAMQGRISRYTVSRWTDDFLQSLSDVKTSQEVLSVQRLTRQAEEHLAEKYISSAKRLFLLDYDGTLIGFADRPEKAGPDEKLEILLSNLSKDSKNEVVIISGRDKTTLERWFSRFNISLIAEHGAWLKPNGDKKWHQIEPLRDDWKDNIRPLLELYADRTPRSFVEEKDFCLVWHYRRSDPALANIRSQELRAALTDLTANLNIGVFEGHKILEVKNIGVSKGRAAQTWLAKDKWGFILAAGDDYTDDELFEILPPKAYSIKVGYGISKARFNVFTVDEFRAILNELTEVQ
jgi:trehalose 6-phosphate synthase/phosphatase